MCRETIAGPWRKSAAFSVIPPRNRANILRDYPLLRNRDIAFIAANGRAAPGNAEIPVTAALTACACSLTSVQYRL